MQKLFALLFSILLFLLYQFLEETPSQTTATSTKNERYYQERLCKEHNGLLEYRLPDKTRIDCLTKEYAIEVDFAKKWAQSIGQSLYYAQMSGRKPAVAIIADSEEERYLKRLEKVATEYGIKIIYISKE